MAVLFSFCFIGTGFSNNFFTPMYIGVQGKKGEKLKFFLHIHDNAIVGPKGSNAMYCEFRSLEEIVVANQPNNHPCDSIPLSPTPNKEGWYRFELDFTAKKTVILRLGRKDGFENKIVWGLDESVIYRTDDGEKISLIGTGIWIGQKDTGKRGYIMIKDDFQ